MESGLSHEREESQSLERYRLATCVRTGHDQKIVVLTQFDVHRNNRVLLEQWVSSLPDIDDSVCVEYRFGSLVASCK